MARTISISMPSLVGIACLTPALAEKVRVVFVTLAMPSTTFQVQRKQRRQVDLNAVFSVYKKQKKKASFQ